MCNRTVHVVVVDDLPPLLLFSLRDGDPLTLVSHRACGWCRPSLSVIERRSAPLPNGLFSVVDTTLGYPAYSPFTHDTILPFPLPLPEDGVV